MDDNGPKKDALKNIVKYARELMGGKIKGPMAIEISAAKEKPKGLSDDPEERKKKIKEALGLS